MVQIKDSGYELNALVQIIGSGYELNALKILGPDFAL
jgi:hypothetical protein